MEKWSLTALANGLLAHAGSASSRHNTHTIHGGHPHLLRQTVIALAAGQSLDRHEHHGEATVQVLRGRVRMAAGDDTTDAAAGQLLIVPDARHTVAALEEAVLLLTVAERAFPSGADPDGHRPLLVRTDATANRPGPRRHRRTSHTTLEGKTSP